MKFYALFYALLALSAPITAIADCPTFNGRVSQTTGTTYNPAGLTDQLVNISVTASRDLDQECERTQVVIGSSSGQIELRNGSSVLVTQILPSSAVGVVTSAAVNISSKGTSDLVKTGGLALPILKIFPGQYVPPGQYSADLELQIGNGAPELFSIVVMVEPALRFIAGTGGTRRLDLGDVSAGAQKTDSFAYHTNAPLSVSVHSDNGGVLVHSLGRDYGQIPYSAYLSGRPLSLARPSILSLDLRNTEVQSEQLKVVVAPQPARYAGQYSDTLTLEFTPY